MNLLSTRRKTKKKTFRKTLSLLTAATLCCSALNFNAFATGNTNDSIVTDYVFDVDYQIINEWEDTKQIAINITNTGDNVIEQWALQYDFDGEIRNIWSAKVYDAENSIITNADYNADLKPGESTTFGYIIDNNTTVPQEFKMCQERVEKNDGYEVTLSPSLYYGKSFNGTITVKNLTAEPIKNWNLKFDASFDIKCFWMADCLSQTGNTYTVAGNSNTVIPAEGEVSFDFGADYDEELEISNISLSEIVINANHYEEDPEDNPTVS